VIDTNTLLAQATCPAEQRVDTRTSSPSQARWAYFFLLLFTLFLYARPNDYIRNPILSHAALVIGICAGAFYLAALIAGNAPLVWSTELTLMFLLTGWFLLGVLFSVWRSNSLDLIVQVWVRTLFIFFLITQTLLSLDRIRRLLWVIIWSELLVAGLSVVLQENATERGQHVIQNGERLGGVTLGLLSANFLGIAIGMTLPFMAVLFITRRSLLKSIVLLATCALAMWMLVLTRSRSGLLTVWVSTVLTWLLILRRRARGRVAGFVLLLIIAIAAALSPQSFWDRVGSLWNASHERTGVVISAEESAWARKDALQHSVQFTLEHPVFGLGLGNFIVVYNSTVGKAYAWIGTHNTFTQLSSEAGIPALLLYVAMSLVLLRNLGRITRSPSNSPQAAELDLLARGTIAATLTFLFGELFAHLAYDFYFYYVIGIGICLQAVARGIGLPLVETVKKEVAAHGPDSDRARGENSQFLKGDPLRPTDT
jgi:O-antigen ligase